MLTALDSALADAGRKRADIDIVMMPGDDSVEAAQAFADLGVDRLIPMVSLTSKKQTEQRVEYLVELANKFSQA